MKINQILFIKLFTFSVLLFFSCNEDDITSSIQIDDTGKLNEVPIEGYIPVGNVTDVKLKNGLNAYLDEDSVCFIGDVIFPNSWILSDSNNTKGIAKSSMTKNVSWYWKQSTIPYYIQTQDGSYIFSENDKGTIRNGISLLSAATTINFVEVSSVPTTGHYIRFIPGNGNYSPIGKQTTNENAIHLSPLHFIGGTVAHEVMHTLGYFHEQCRADRAAYVTINWNNIESGKEHNFNIYTSTYGFGYDLGTLDFNSIMMYGSYDFSSNGQPTITKLDGSTFSANRFYLSSGDISGLQFIYGPRPEIEQTVVDEYVEFGDYSEITYEYDNILYFKSSNGDYITLDYPRLVVITYSVTRADSDLMPPYTTTTSETRIVPAGTSSISLGRTRFVDRREYGNTIEYYSSSFFIETP